MQLRLAYWLGKFANRLQAALHLELVIATALLSAVSQGFWPYA